MSASITSGTYPRAAHPASGGLQGFGASLWRAFTRAGAHRAYPELMRMAQRKDHSDPALALQLREAARELMKG